MPFDGFVMKNVVESISKKIIGLNIRNIYLSKNTLFFSFDSGDLKVCLNTNFAHISFVNHLIDEPEKNTFIDFLRSKIRGAKVVDFSNLGYERTAILRLKKIDEIGTNHNYTIYFDIMGKHSNAIIVEDGEILDAFKRIETRVRKIYPGEKFVLFTSEKKTVDEISSIDVLKELIKGFKDKNRKVSEFIYSSIQGFSRVTAQELLYKADIDDKPLDELSQNEIELLFDSLESIKEEISSRKLWLYYENEEPVDISCIKLHIYNDEKLCEDLISSVNEYFSFVEVKERLFQKRNQLSSVIKSKIAQYEDLKIKIEKELLECSEIEKYRKYGELLKAYSYQIEHGIELVTLFDWENNEEIAVPLEKNLTPIENSIRYFNLYTKLKRKAKGLDERKRIIDRELLYLQQLLLTVENAENIEDLNEIEDEMIENDILKKKTQKKAKKAKKESELSQLRKYVYNGFTIYVGKNNRQNDELVKKASDSDIWLHVQGMPGAHVVIKTNGKSIDEDTLYYAAKLAAMYSKGKYSTNVPVDYTFIKYVKKPKGFKPGLVLYSNFKTIFVDPTG